MRGIWINIFDLLDAKKTGTRVLRFPNLRALAEYSYENEKVFPLKKAKGGALKFLLRKISKTRRAEDGLSLENAFRMMSI